MAKAKQLDEWGRAANLLALIANVNRDQKKRRQPFDAYDFIPETLATRPKKRRKTAAELFAKLAGFEGLTVEIVTESTWQAAEAQTV